MRERFLQASHESSIELLYRIGWKPADTMCAYLLSMTTNRMYSLSPDAVREAVRLDGETAVRLLDKKVLGEMIVHHHSSYQAWLSDGELREKQTANYFSDIYPIDCAVLSANAQSCPKCCTLLPVLLSA